MYIKNVILVEDDAATRMLIKFKLRKNNINVFEFATAENCLEYAIICDEHIDLILSDMMLPGINGDEFIKKIREINKYEKIPVIIISASDYISIPNCEHISKPFELNYLILRVKSVLNI